MIEVEFELHLFLARNIETGGSVSFKLDIFRKLPDGQLLWVKAVENLDEATAQLRELAQINPGEYFIYDSFRGRRIELPAVA